MQYNSYTQSLSQISESLETAIAGDYDIVPFLRSGSGRYSYWMMVMRMMIVIVVMMIVIVMRMMIRMMILKFS